MVYGAYRDYRRWRDARAQELAAELAQERAAGRAEGIEVGRASGRVEGIEEGIAEGRAAERARVRRGFAELGITLSPEVEKILSGEPEGHSPNAGDSAAN